MALNLPAFKVSQDSFKVLQVKQQQEIRKYKQEQTRGMYHSFYHMKVSCESAMNFTVHAYPISSFPSAFLASLIRFLPYFSSASALFQIIIKNNLI